MRLALLVLCRPGIQPNPPTRYQLFFFTLGLYTVLAVSISVPVAGALKYSNIALRFDPIIDLVGRTMWSVSDVFF